MLLSSFLNFPISEEVIPFSMYWQYNFLNLWTHIIGVSIGYT